MYLGAVGEAFTGMVEVKSWGGVYFSYPGINGPVCGPEWLLNELVDYYREVGGRFAATLYGQRTSSQISPARYCEWTVEAWELAPPEAQASDTAVGTSEQTVEEYGARTVEGPTEPPPDRADPGSVVETTGNGSTAAPGDATSPGSIQTAGPGPEMLGWLLLAVLGSALTAGR